MSMTDWSTPLKRILNCPVRIVSMPLSDWDELTKQAASLWNANNQSEQKGASVWTEGSRIEHDHKVWVVVGRDNHSVEALEIESDTLQPTELELITWTVQLQGSSSNPLKYLQHLYLKVKALR